MVSRLAVIFENLEGFGIVHQSLSSLTKQPALLSVTHQDTVTGSRSYRGECMVWGQRHSPWRTRSCRCIRDAYGPIGHGHREQCRLHEQ